MMILPEIRLIQLGRREDDMELSSQIKKFRAELGMSQEQLGEKIFVSRQTISNWETEKSYPDIHSLLLLSSVFNVSLDTLIKGDIDMIKETVKQNDVRHFNLLSNIFAVLYVLCLISPILLLKFFGLKGMVILGGMLWVVTMLVAFKVEKAKKKHDLRTYREILAFVNGNDLDKEAQKRENEKAKYQKILYGLISGIIALLVNIVMGLLLK